MPSDVLQPLVGSRCTSHCVSNLAQDSAGPHFQNVLIFWVLRDVGTPLFSFPRNPESCHAHRARLAVLYLKLPSAVQNYPMATEHHIRGLSMRTHEHHRSRSSWAGDGPRIADAILLTSFAASGRFGAAAGFAWLQRPSLRHEIRFFLKKKKKLTCIRVQRRMATWLMPLPSPILSSVERWAGPPCDQTFGCLQPKYHCHSRTKLYRHAPPRVDPVDAAASNSPHVVVISTHCGPGTTRTHLRHQSAPLRLLTPESTTYQAPLWQRCCL